MKGKYFLFAALFSSLISVSGFMALPLSFTPIPIVLQNIMVLLTAVVLGPFWGSMSVLIFLLSGLCGLPVFSGFQGGVARFISPTGGFLYGYLLSCFITGLISKNKDSKVIIFLSLIFGILTMYITGLIHFIIVTKKTLSESLLMCIAPYIIPDLIKCTVFTFIAKRLRYYSKILIFDNE